MNCGIGRHTLFENDQAIIFEGSWMDNKFHGYGRRILNQGDYWMSQLKMGKYHGHHIQFNFDNSVQAKGIYNLNKLQE